MFFVFMSIMGGNAAASRFLEKDKATVHKTKFLAHVSCFFTLPYTIVNQNFPHYHRCNHCYHHITTADTFAVCCWHYKDSNDYHHHHYFPFELKFSNCCCSALQAGSPSYCLTNSIKPLKGGHDHHHNVFAFQSSAIQSLL